MEVKMCGLFIVSPPREAGAAAWEHRGWTGWFRVEGMTPDNLILAPILPGLQAKSACQGQIP
jgi:hypothetical protein